MFKTHHAEPFSASEAPGSTAPSTVQNATQTNQTGRSPIGLDQTEPVDVFVQAVAEPLEATMTAAVTVTAGCARACQRPALEEKTRQAFERET